MNRKDWATRAHNVQQRHRYHYTQTDLLCGFQEPHWHGVACDFGCHCKATQE